MVTELGEIYIENLTLKRTLSEKSSYVTFSPFFRLFQNTILQFAIGINTHYNVFTYKMFHRFRTIDLDQRGHIGNSGTLFSLVTRIDWQGLQVQSLVFLRTKLELIVLPIVWMVEQIMK